LELAKRIRIEETTIYNWKNNRSKPKVYLLPKIIKFLKYVPFELANETIGDKIFAYRKEHGLSRRKLAKLLYVDQTTIRDCERNKHNPSKKMLVKISNILTINPFLNCKKNAITNSHIITVEN
jgi:DNA-binding XRE family transcriptional regulator